MPEFTYVARGLDGKRVSGTLHAASERDVVSQLSNKSLFPIDVASETPRGGTSSVTRGRIPDHAMVNFFSSLASLLRGGVPLLRSLKVVRTDLEPATQIDPRRRDRPRGGRLFDRRSICSSPASLQ